jgi:hypothetical protein
MSRTPGFSDPFPFSLQIRRPTAAPDQHPVSQENHRDGSSNETKSRRKGKGGESMVETKQCVVGGEREQETRKKERKKERRTDTLCACIASRRGWLLLFTSNK